MEVYEPAEDSYLLAEEVKKYAKKGMKVLDMGCGSGIQGRTAAENGAEVVYTDINPQAPNAIVSDLFSNIKEKFDLIVFNPPYLPADPVEYIDLDGGKEGCEIAVRFLKEAEEHLNEGGRILLLLSTLTKPEIVEDEIKKLGFTCRITARKKLPWEELLVYVIFKR